MKEKLLGLFGIVALAAIVLALSVISTKQIELKGVESYDLIGFPSSTVVSVNATATQVLSGWWRSYARLENRGNKEVSCLADDLTAASSSATSTIGVKIAVSSTNPSYVEFGRCPHCYPFVGRVNCATLGGSGSIVQTSY